jgi:hypothetical protein
VNAVWSFDDPFPAVSQIKGHVAFYPERVDEIAEQPATWRRSWTRGEFSGRMSSCVPERTVRLAHRSGRYEASRKWWFVPFAQRHRWTEWRDHLAPTAGLAGVHQTD